MMEWTDRHDRFFLRLISRRARLYTEMITTGALLHGNAARFLAFNAEEHPVALQLGGAEPADLAQCARMGAAAGYDEINLNVGCPSDRVQNARFGAYLMAEPDLVAACVGAMKAAVDVPVTVKTRIGIDDQDSYEALAGFTARVREAGCDVLIVHARKAWLTGLSPKQNREVPPLRYDVVARLKGDFPDFPIVLNGGIETLDQVAEHLDRFDGVMLGRAAYQNPYMLVEVDARFFGADGTPPTRHEVADAMADYAARQMGAGVPLKSITRHILGLFNGLPGARRWRRLLSEEAHKPDATPDLIRRAALLVPADGALRLAG